MVEIFIDGEPVEADDTQTVMQAAHASGREIPGFCWHPALSAPGNCRVCMVEVGGEGAGAGWFDIACNMPVANGLRILTDTPRVRARRKEMLQFVTLNHPVDCGICDKSGECTLQDYHYQYNGSPSTSRDAKVRATKNYPLSARIVLDNERCILCSRCVRFTREISKSNALGIQHRGDGSLIRAVEDGAFDGDPYSDNVIDICPVGALLSRPFLHKVRVWYLEPTASICPGCERGCNVDIWHRKKAWKLRRLDPAENARIDRVTPRDNPAVNGPWICNKGRDLAQVFEQPRATEALLKGRAVDLDTALRSAHELIGAARRPVALVSSWGSNEELAAFDTALGPRFACHVKVDRLPEPGERIEDELLIKPDKNPNRAAARALYPALPTDSSEAFPADCDLVLVWGEGCDYARLPAAARTIHLDAWRHPEHDVADVFLPISVQTERSGHYTNFAGVVSRFDACFDKPAGVADAAALFAALGSPVAGGAA
ncbi:MAG: 2Fe-2S iron-sulfur cluster-binding protein [Caldimonas sp.]